MSEELKNILNELNIDILDSLMDCGFIVTGLYPDYKVLYASALFVSMLGYGSYVEMCESIDGKAINLVDASDLSRAKSEGAARSRSGVYEISYSLKCKNGERRFMTQRSCHKILKNGSEVILAAYFDAAPAKAGERMRLEKEKLESDFMANHAEQKLRIAMANSELAVWECVFSERKNYYLDETVERFHIPGTVSNVPDGLIATGHVHPDSVEQLKSLYSDVMSGKPRAEGTVATVQNGEIRWLKIIMTTLYDENNVQTSAICTAEDITKEKLLLKQMESELARRSAYENNLRSKGYYDLTDDSIIEYSTKNQPDKDNRQFVKYSILSKYIESSITNEADKENFHSSFSLESLVQSFESGVGEISLDYCRSSGKGDVDWVSTQFCMMRQPSNNHIVAFMYTTDVNEQKQTKAILNSIANENYDGIILISLADGTYHSFTQTKRTIMSLPMSGTSYWNDLSTSLKECLSPTDYEKAKKTRTKEYILKQLEHNSKCVFVSTLHGSGGKSKTMKMQYTYLDANRRHLIATGMDITSAVREEKHQKEALESALLAAKQASSAKTSFLSRMSHEIRTPLNAILGMTALAAQSGGNDDEIQDCISKIGISGHYLLSLINDILDMSRIESGKMLLRSEAFNFADFIDSITTVIYGQTTQKGINYETIVAHGIDDGYIGDAMKLQQVLVNILGNAVKFTSDGGKITFSISLVSRNEKTAVLRFAVNDTGCGITEEALERIFEPFEQQDGSTTTVYGGTGLGLAISKNLVELMGGTIRVRSIVDVGSEFTIEVPLGIDKTLVKKHTVKYSFADLRTLIVDDDILVCEQTSKTLQDIGMIPEWVTSGEDAIKKVSERWSRHSCFDFILVDWKMPDMDGIETSRRIRRIVGPDVTIIIITAYDWISIESEARAAGVNMCISKPMLKSTLVSAFTKATGEAEHELMANAEPDFDLSGKRILLAEDHPLNAEIAVRLLKKKNCLVEVAENGLKALERFTTTAVGYYDAILMDIRMPIMDGLQAATNIRHWDKADAKTIPIIAMTANAFDEDVDKSKSAGMDAHLAKPIDPKILYRVLYRLTN